ncbi:hypothetical protein IMCC3135_04640 [Granulosicoccus antarcticus IMCC3135]|uniref:Uncharacterized protein n=2 Tax=Granulosicoccus TaxID=437504 RepID=A0A2Z2NM32_9GAMM|nr:hypothetical protein IMCC3135_04640 [Granulosicoccus antarcticus IMCC3135]
MVSMSRTCLIQPTTCLQDFFRERIVQATGKLRLDGNDETVWYLTQLLCNYSKTNQFLDNNGTGATLTPLAEYYRMALESASRHERRLLLQRLGDVAIVVAGLFSGALNRKPIGVSYYISMGESAYATLADEASQSSRDRALQGIFETLATDFSDYVEVLSAIPSQVSHEKDLLELVDEWENTQHPTLARELRRQGVFIDENQNNKTPCLH